MKSSVISALGFVAAASASYASAAYNVSTTPASTTSTVYTTSVYTITSCAPTVTDCPGRLGQVTTDIISLYTTVCPVETEVKTTPTASYPVETPWTTSTVYSTTEYTITKCPASVTNCPIGSKTSSVITYTTYCPVATTTPATTPYTQVPPPYSVSSKPYTVIPPVSSSKPVLSTITISTCVPSVYTSVITVTSTPAVTYPVGQATVTTKAGTASGTGYPVGPKNTTTPYVPVTGGASSVKVGALMAVVGLAALL